MTAEHSLELKVMRIFLVQVPVVANPVPRKHGCYWAIGDKIGESP